MPFRDADMGHQLGPNIPVSRANQGAFIQVGPQFHGDVLPASKPFPSFGMIEASKIYQEEPEQHNPRHELSAL